VWALFAFVVGGVGVLLGPSPSSVDALVPDPARIAWALVLLAGGLLGLVSEIIPDRVLGLILERAALVGVGGPALAYALAVLAIAGPGGFAAGVLIGSVGWASLARARDVTRTLRGLETLSHTDTSRE
jgi:hypothetical protein